MTQRSSMDGRLVNIAPRGPVLGGGGFFNPRNVARAYRAGQSLGRGLKRAYNSYASSAPKRVRRMAGRLTRGRRAPRRRKRRFARKTVGKRRGGRRYRSGPAKVGRSLITNFNRNDYKTFRAVQNLGEIEVKSGVLLQNNTRFICELDHWTTEWADEIEKYSQFRMSNIQFVLKPRSVITSAHDMVVASNEIPYLTMRTVNPTDTEPALQSIPKLQQTPGVRYIPIQRKSRTVQNCAPMMTQLDSFVHTTGTSSYERQKIAGWMDITTSTKTLALSAIEVSVPAMSVVSPSNLYWDVSVYATIHLRGNNTQLIEPHS